MQPGVLPTIFFLHHLQSKLCLFLQTRFLRILSAFAVQRAQLLFVPPSTTWSMFTLQQLDALLSWVLRFTNVHSMFQWAVFGRVKGPKWSGPRKILQSKYLSGQLPILSKSEQLPIMPTGLLPVPEPNMFHQPMHIQLHNMLIHHPMLSMRARLLHVQRSMRIMHRQLQSMH